MSSFQEKFPDLLILNKKTILKYINRFRATGSVIDRMIRKYMLPEEKLDETDNTLKASQRKSFVGIKQQRGVSA